MSTTFDVVVVFIHNIINVSMPVRFVNQLKLDGLGRSHPVHMAAAAVTLVTDKQRQKRKNVVVVIKLIARYRGLMTRTSCTRHPHVGQSP